MSRCACSSASQRESVWRRLKGIHWRGWCRSFQSSGGLVCGSRSRRSHVRPTSSTGWRSTLPVAGCRTRPGRPSSTIWSSSAAARLPTAFNIAPRLLKGTKPKQSSNGWASWLRDGSASVSRKKWRRRADVRSRSSATAAHDPPGGNDDRQSCVKDQNGDDLLGPSTPRLLGAGGRLGRYGVSAHKIAGRIQRLVDACTRLVVEVRQRFTHRADGIEHLAPDERRVAVGSRCARNRLVTQRSREILLERLQPL